MWMLEFAVFSRLTRLKVDDRHIPSNVPLSKGSGRALMILPKGASPLSSIADEEDFLDLVIASERVGAWLETIERSISQGTQKITNT